ncbi:hypothetical protein RHGRI_020513 [Rhododendron griersonianum]|uniref:Uncharacterized protein n=1 Tax=Rhododendron griersonianum TaxID=479676 RepID=A0AAV6JGI6_9ERIC|nr:hypothetical protein RHGRI_020513 [Rhododendron griersonianum]
MVVSADRMGWWFGLGSTVGMVVVVLICGWWWWLTVVLGIVDGYNLWCFGSRSCCSSFGQGIVGLETEHGTLHIKVNTHVPGRFAYAYNPSPLQHLSQLFMLSSLFFDPFSFLVTIDGFVQLFPDCAPYLVAFILELLNVHHCASCQFYRVEGRGQIWDSQGNHLKDVGLQTLLL